MALTDVFLKNALVNPFLCDSDRVILKDRYTLCKIGLMCVCNGMTSGMLSKRNRNRIVIVISKFLKHYSKPSAPGHQLLHELCDELKGVFEKVGQEKLMSDFQNTRRGQSSC